jgi:hypothetical protein
LRSAQTNEALTRSAASALYHVASAAVMAWEAARTNDPRRAALAGMVVRHRVLPRDPLEDVHGDETGLLDLLEAA